MRDREHQIQVACVRWFRYAYPHSIIYAVPNGGQRNAIVAAKLKAEGVLSGIPDLCVAEAQCGYHALYVEMKNGTAGKVSESQKGLIAQLQEKGYCCVVCRSFDEFEKVVSEYMEGTYEQHQ